MTEEQQPVAGFLDAQCLAALQAIRGPEVAKKRATVLLLAMAEASGTAMTTVFRDSRACSESIWYTKWKHIPAIAAALETLTARALAWRDAETARVEAHALQERRKAIAEGSLDAVRGLRITTLNQEDRADYRTAASALLLSLADEELGARILAAQKGQAITVEVEGLDALIEHELARVAATGESGAAGAVAGVADGVRGQCGGTRGAD